MRRQFGVAALSVVGVLAGCMRGAGPHVVQFSRTGGIAALHDVLDVRTSGAMTLSTRREGVKGGNATAEELQRLRTLIDTPEFAALPGEFRAEGIDLITYTIKADTSRGRKTITTMGEVDKPKVLVDVMYELRKLCEKCR